MMLLQIHSGCDSGAGGIRQMGTYENIVEFVDGRLHDDGLYPNDIALAVQMA